MTAAITIAFYFACIAACHTIAKRRGARPVYWSAMGALFGPFAIPFVCMAKPDSRLSSNS